MTGPRRAASGFGDSARLQSACLSCHGQGVQTLGYVTHHPSPSDTLVIVPCGKAKIWDRNPDAGPTSARDAYTGYPFRVNAAYAERFGTTWLILSAKYGFIDPSFLIPGPYDVSFNRRDSEPISIEKLNEQVRDQGLDCWRTVILLGGRHYREAVEAALDGTGAVIHSPFAGLPLGRMVRAARRAIEQGDPNPGC